MAILQDAKLVGCMRPRLQQLVCPTILSRQPTSEPSEEDFPTGGKDNNGRRALVRSGGRVGGTLARLMQCLWAIHCDALVGDAANVQRRPCSSR